MSKIIIPGHPHFNIHKRNYLEIETAPVRIGVSGHFTMRAIKPGFGVVRELSFDNLITNLGLNAMGSSCSFARMHLGTGTTPPSPTDTALSVFGVNVSDANPTYTQSSNSGAPDYYGITTQTWTSPVGAATGNWTEIGISSGNSNGNLRSRALIVDANGDPTTFTVLADEQFQGSYTTRTYMPLTDDVRSVTLGPITYDAMTRAANIQRAGSGVTHSSVQIFAMNQLLAASTGAAPVVTGTYPTGGISGASGIVTLGSYGTDNYYRDTEIRFGSGVLVASGIRTFTMRNNVSDHWFNVEYNPTITKLTTEELIINQRTSWARR